MERLFLPKIRRFFINIFHKNSMMKKLNLLFVFILLLLLNSCKVPTASKLKDKSILNTWYAGQRVSEKKMVINPTSIVSVSTSFEDKINEEELNNLKWKIVDTVDVHNLKFVEEKNTFFAVISRNEQNQKRYKGMSIENTNTEGFKLLMISVQEFLTLEEAQDDIKNKAFLEVQQVPIFSENFQNSSLKSVMQMSKEEYVKIIKKVKSLEADLRSYVTTLKENGVENYQDIGNNLIQSNFRKQVYLAGFDAYSAANEDPFADFDKDPEVEKLLESDKK